MCQYIITKTDFAVCWFESIKRSFETWYWFRDFLYLLDYKLKHLESYLKIGHVLSHLIIDMPLKEIIKKLNQPKLKYLR